MAWTWEATFVCVLLVLVLGILWLEKIPPELVTLSALVLVWYAGIISTSQALSGFGNEGMLTVAFLFIVIAAVDRSRIVEQIARHVLGTKTSLKQGSFRLQIMLFIASAFFNNTPLVALMLPIVRDWARQRNFPASQLLIPLAFSTVAGGCLTTIGTSTNLIVQGLLEDRGLDTFGFFEPGYVVVWAGLIMIVYLVFASPYLLPSHNNGLLRAIQNKTQELITEVEITEEFPYLNKTVEKVLAKLHLRQSNLLKIRRILQEKPKKPEKADDDDSSSSSISSEEEGLATFDKSSSPRQVPEESKQELLETRVFISEHVQEIFPVPMDEVIQAGDILILSGTAEGLFEWQRKGPRKGFKLLNWNAAEIAGFGTNFYELVISNHNPFLGKSALDSDFMEFYGVKTVAVRERGSDEVLHAPGVDVKALVLKPGDIVLVLAKSDFADQWSGNKGFLLVTSAGSLPKRVHWTDYIPLIVFLVMLVIVAFELVSMIEASIGLALVFMLVQWVDVADLARIVDWNLLLLIASSLGFSTAIDKSGLADEVGSLISRSSLGSYGSYVCF